MLCKLIFLATITTAYGISTSKERKIAFPIFPTNTAAGILIALALPIDIPRKNVYLSYNFEANHGTPTLATDYTSSLLQNLFNESKKLKANLDEKETKRSLSEFTRKRFYGVLEENMNMYNINGKFCLLKTICEVAQSKLYQHNALAGHILHVLFTPSVSISEDFPKEIFEAEQHGLKGDCQRFKKCAISLLDYISVLI